MPHYAKAPVTEALIDIGVRLPEDVDVAKVEGLHEAVKENFPTKSPLLGGRFQFNITTEGASEARIDQGQAGWVFEGQREGNVPKEVWMARGDGFSYHRLPPYGKWEDLAPRARSLWNIYRDMCRPVELTGCHVRYVNRLDLPNTMKDLREYLLLTPQVPQDLGDAMSGFLMQVQLIRNESKTATNLTAAIVPPVQPDVISIVLDIDVVRQHDVPQDDDGLWAMLSQMRDAKNNAFEACITEAYRELIR